MPLKRTVICRFTIAGTPDWVANTLKRAAILPDKERVHGSLGTLRSELISDTTEEVTVEEAPTLYAQYTVAEVIRAMALRNDLGGDIEEALRIIALERHP